MKHILLAIALLSINAHAADSEYICTGEGYEFRVDIKGMTNDEKLLYTLNGTKYTALFDSIQEGLAFFGSDIGQNYLIIAINLDSSLSSLTVLGVENEELTKSGVIPCY